MATIHEDVTDRWRAEDELGDSRKRHRLIVDPLDVSWIKHSKIRLRKEIIDARPVLRQAVETVRPFAEARNQKLGLSFTSPDVWLHADPLRLQQIVVNLLKNATRFTPPGGHIQLGAGVEGKEVIIRVRDDGLGIPPEMRARIFDLFAQDDRLLARPEGGLGIGLTLVRSLVEMHGGTVTATSAGPGLGGVFVVRLPAADGTNAAKGPEQAATKKPSRAVGILIVDDSADTAIGMAKLLKRVGHDVRVAHDGRGAIESACAHRPEVIFIDTGLPDMDGYEVAATLRLEEYGREAILIAISGSGGDQVRKRVNEAGFDHYFVKPVDFEALFTFLNRLDAVA